VRISTKDGSSAIQDLQAFSSNGALSGQFDREGAYIVRSYNTPILIVSPDGRTAYLNEVRYSVTTSKHQGIARSGVAKMESVQIERLDDPEEFETRTGYRVRLGRIS
jgi:hypothetical protein